MKDAFHSNGVRSAWTHISRFNWYSRRANSIPAALADLQLLETTIQVARANMVADMRADGCTWEEIGEALGCSRQAAQQRYRTVTK